MPPSSSRESRNAKRHKPNVPTSAPAPAPVAPVVGSALKKKVEPGPVYEKGIEYWDKVEASVDGVLGGFGTGPVPHIEQLSSRLLLLSLIPSLCPFPNPLNPSPKALPAHRRTVLDVGAGIGRVSRHVLLPLFDDVITIEPVEKFVREAYRSAISGEWRNLPLLTANGDEENKRRVEESRTGRGKRVRFIRGGLQGLDPRYPGKGGEEVGIVGEKREGEGGCDDDQIEYDVIWCQWCLGHMNHPDLVSFLKRSHSALRQDQDHSEQSYIFVKENCCEDGPNGEPVEFLDEEDSSLTRSSGKWLQCFKEAGLQVVTEEVQQGMPNELFVVKAWALK